jgi:trehalose-phosphatase
MSEPPPPALERMPEISARLRGRRLAAFLDYDGTLTPIVARPELAVLGNEVRGTLERLARLAPVAVVSGRDLEDVRERVGLDLVYAGSHGFDIAGPGGVRYEHPQGVAALPALDAAERQLRAALARVDGVLLERKRYSLAVHYRHVRAAITPMVERAVDAALGLAAGLRKTRGKSVFDLLPDFDWDKGAAVLWLLERLGLGGPEALPLYIGDDLTDEDAFRALAGRGLGIAVFAEPRPTAAQFRLRDPAEVRGFLGALADLLERAR